MRGLISGQAMLFSHFSPGARVPATHPLRPIKAMTDEVLQTCRRPVRRCTVLLAVICRGRIPFQLSRTSERALL
jgi:hypothetical protein